MTIGRAALDRTPRLRIARVITGLEQGGAEESLRKLTVARQHDEHATVVSLRDGGVLGAALQGQGIALLSLGLNGMPHARVARRVMRGVRRQEWDVLEGWMVHGNLAASAFASLGRRTPVIWNMRSSLADLAGERTRTRWLISLGARMSRHVNAIVYNSQRALDEHRAAGYRGRRQLVIPNGFDIERFVPSPVQRALGRQRLDIDATVPVVGHVSRWHAQKDHRMLLDAFANARREIPGALLVMIGEGLTPANAELQTMIRDRQLSDAVRLVGRQADLPAWYPVFDAFGLTSVTEAFPNVLGEAMACGVAALSTDVGDAGPLLDGVGVIVPVGDAMKAGMEIARLLREEPTARAARAQRGRDRIAQHYSLEAMRERYAALYEEVLRDPK